MSGLLLKNAVFGAVVLGLHGLARATADLDLFIRPDARNVERLKEALRMVFEDPNIEDITAEDLCGDYPAVCYYPADRFGFGILTCLGDAFKYADLDVEEKDTARPADRFDADVLAERFGFREE